MFSFNTFPRKKKIDEPKRFPNVLMAPQQPGNPGGTELAPRPRPLLPEIEARPQRDMLMDYEQASGVPFAPVPPQRTPVQDTQAEIDRIQTKDYSIQKDERGNVIHRGKDRDKKWSLGDKILSALTGMFNGDGLIPAATDRNYMERQQDKQELGYLRPRLAQQQQAEDFGRDQEYKQAQLDYAKVRPQLEQQKIESVDQYRDDQIEIRRQQQELREKTQTWKEADRSEYYRLEREKQDALKQNRADLYDLAVRRQIEIERHNKVGEGQADKRIGQADQRIAGSASKAEAARQKLAGMSETARQKAIDQAVQKWITQNKGASPEDIANTRRRLNEIYGK